MSDKLEKYAKLQFQVKSKTDTTQADIFLDYDMGGRSSLNTVSQENMKEIKC